MDKILDFLRNNLSWIQGLFGIVFSTTATVLAILTYQRAKETILQPVRNEVIKQQTGILANLLTDIGECHPVSDLDYLGIVASTVFMTLCGYGFVFDDHKEVMKKVRNDIAGQVYCGKKSRIDDFEVVKWLPDTKIALDALDGNEYRGKVRYEQIKSGYVEIEWIYLTHQHMDFMDKFNGFKRDPFLPSAVKDVLDDISTEISVNLVEHMPPVVAQCVQDFSEAYSSNASSSLLINPIGPYNEFNHIRIHHKENFNELSRVVRDYLKIDSVPWK